MAGQIKKMLDQIIETRSHGDAFLIRLTKTKLIIKGVDPERYNCNSEDDLRIINEIRRIAEEMGVTLYE